MYIILKKINIFILPISHVSYSYAAQYLIIGNSTLNLNHN